MPYQLTMQGKQEQEQNNNQLVLSEKPQRKWRVTINPYLDPYQFISYRHWTHYNLKLLQGTSTVEDQGVNSTMANFKKILGAEVLPDYVQFNLQSRSRQQYNIGLLIDRLQSLGDANCHQVAQNLRLLDMQFEEKKNILKQIKWKSMQYYRQQIKLQNFIMFYCPFLGDEGFRITNILISRSLLKLLGYTEQSLILKSLKIESVLIQPISGRNNYVDTVLGYLKIVNEFLSQLQQQQCKDQINFKPITIKIKSKIMTARNEYLFCDASRVVYSPECFYIEILNVYHKECVDKLPQFWSKLPNTLHNLQVNDSKMLCEVGFKNNIYLRRAGYSTKMDIQRGGNKQSNTNKQVKAQQQIIPE